MWFNAAYIVHADHHLYNKRYALFSSTFSYYTL